MSELKRADEIVFLAALGERLRRSRLSWRYSQKVVGSFVGIAQPMLSAYESGRRAISIGTLVALSEVYGVGLEELVTGKVFEVGCKRKEGERLTEPDTKVVMWANRLLTAYCGLLKMEAPPCTKD